MTETQKDKIGKLIGNTLLLISIIIIPLSYINLYDSGHKQCSKSDLENSTFLITACCYALIFVIVLFSLSKSKKANGYINKFNINRKLLSAFLVVFMLFFMIIYFLVGFEIQNLIERKIEIRIEKELNVDGVLIKGIVQKSYSKYYGRRHSKIKYDQIEFKYILDKKIIHSCYSLKYGKQYYLKIGDTLNFIVSKSNPEYVLLKE